MESRKKCFHLSCYSPWLLLLLLVDAKASNNVNYDKYCDLTCEDGQNKSITHTVCSRKKEKCGPDPSCGPDFKVIPLNDADRQYIVDIHNYLRNKVSLGFEKRGSQPTASNMMAMSYNMELEFIAQCWANACKGSPLEHDQCRRTHVYEHVGQNLGFVNSSTPEINKVNSTKELIVAWYEEVKDYDSSWINDTKERDAEVGHYTQLVWAESTDIGCAITHYSSESEGRTWYHIIFACNYGPGGNYIGREVYKTGKPCSKCSKGKANKKYRGLCGNVKPMSEIKKKISFPSN